MVKKVLSSILVLVMAGSLVACKSNKIVTKDDTATKQTETKKTETAEPASEVIKFESVGQMMDSISEKDHYYSDQYNLKILKKEPLAVYEAKADVITQKAMVDKKIDNKSAKVYKYYNNINGVRFEKDYIVVYDASKVPTTVYEVIISLSDKDEPSLKEVKENKAIITDEFKALFPKELEVK
ncbi:hypothetical protein G9F72_000910 [Clostridium estertheticum]|uniref:hypothetical protein n=1 Tax=Clostridium estertheticum TaxID=238834 RepID=UPI0013E91B79|nr:hypothetical protein [Clostridium estertheticum]MBZ9684920.1 hypothetical protein [Clostridium estertheticum]